MAKFNFNPDEDNVESVVKNAIIEKMLADSGMEHCPKCSLPDWKIYHTPEKCPKRDE